MEDALVQLDYILYMVRANGVQPRTVDCCIIFI